jgi:hypothetical protein
MSIAEIRRLYRGPALAVRVVVRWIIYVKNIDNKSHYSDEFLPHVEGEKGEMTRTLYHRQRRHDPSLPGLAIGGPPNANERAAGKTTVRQCGLTKYYNLGIPAKYSIYVE